MFVVRVLGWGWGAGIPLFRSEHMHSTHTRLPIPLSQEGGKKEPSKDPALLGFFSRKEKQPGSGDCSQPSALKSPILWEAMTPLGALPFKPSLS
jgi:hypothetical protein